MKRLILTYCLLILSLAAWSEGTASVRISQTELTAEVGQYRFTRPRVAVFDGRNDVTSQFYINYYIKGQENNTQDIDNKVQTQNPVTGTTVSQLYGIVTIGSKPGIDTIRVVARPRSGSSYAECESYYTIRIPRIEPHVVLSQDSFLVHTNQLFDFPTAKLYRMTNGGADSTDITSYYDVSYSYSSAITTFSSYWLCDGRSSGYKMLHAPATVTNGLTLTMTYKPKAEYEGAYETYTKIYNVKMYVYTSSDPMPTHIEWAESKYITANNKETIMLPKPIIRDQYGNNVSRMVKIQYDPIGNVSSVIGDMGAYMAGAYSSWTAYLAYQSNDSAYLHVYTYPLGYYYDNPDPVVYQTGNMNDTIIVQGRKRQWQLTINPSTVEMSEGTMQLNNENWKLPNFIVTDPNGEDKSNSNDYQRRIGIPVGAVLSGNPNTRPTGDTVTYRGQKYVMYVAESWTFIPSYTWSIDFSNFKKPDNVPYLIFEIFLYNATQEEQEHDYYNYNVVVEKMLHTHLTLSEKELSCNLNRATKQMMGFTEPTATVYDPNNVVVSQYFTLHYSIADSSTVKSDFTIDENTGELTYTGNGSTDGRLYVNVSATVNSESADIFYNPEPTSYTLVVKPTDFTYEVISTTTQPDSAHYGKLHFTGAGIMAAGTVINEMAGLSIQFGQTGDTDWTLVTSPQPDNEGTVNGSNTVWTEGNIVELDNNGIPVSGTFAILRPSVNGFLTIDGKWEKNNHYYFLQVEGDSIVKSRDYIRTDTDHYGEQWMDEPLMAGCTYYLFNYGADDGTNEPAHLHGFNFEPAFLNSSDDHLPVEYSTTFVNGYTGSVASMVSTATDGVTFSAEKVDGTKDGVNLDDYVTVNSQTGAVTPKRTTAGITESTAKIRNCIIIRGTVTNKPATVTKVENLYLFISEIPTYIIHNGETPSAGERVTTTNIPTNITMTFGGWQNGSGPYFYRKELYDSWRQAKTDTVGADNMTIDGFEFASQGENDARDETYVSFNGSKSNHLPWDVPCRGTYVQFEPEENGTLIVYLLQNGVIDYTGNKDASNFNGQDMAVMKYRPLYIIDEAANNVPLDNQWVMDASLLPSNSQQATNAGSYTEGHYRCTWNDEWVMNQTDSTLCKQNGEEYKDCPFDLYTNYLRRGRGADLDAIMTQWQKYRSDKDTENARQEIIHLATGGYTLISKAFVRYTFQVKAGKTYYVFMTGSKLSICGFSFVPTRFPNEEENISYSMSLDDDDNFDSKFRAVPATNKIDGELRNINVRVNRKFGRNKWTSICLPFSMSQTKFKEFFGNNASVITYDSITADSTGYFTQHVVRGIVANRPYFICPSKDVALGDTIHNVSIESGYGSMAVEDRDNEYAAVSTLAPESAQAGSYVFAGSSIYHLKSALRLGAYRAYLNPLTANAKPIARFASAVINSDDSHTPAGITDIHDYGQTDSQHQPAALRGVYNLKGQKLNDDIESLPPGVYIINGKKQLIGSRLCP